MWYFSWVLGVGLASAFAILNAMWFELKVTDDNATLATAKVRPIGDRQRR